MMNLDDVLAGTYHAKDDLVDPNSVVMGYIKAANRQGAATFTGVEVTSVEGYYVCAGFSGHGFMHRPVAGKIMSEIILDGHASIVDVSALDLARFEGGLLIKE